MIDGVVLLNPHHSGTTDRTQDTHFGSNPSGTLKSLQSAQASRLSLFHFELHPTAPGWSVN